MCTIFCWVRGIRKPFERLLRSDCSPISEERWDSHGLLGHFLSLKLCLVVAALLGADSAWSPRGVYLLTKFFDESFYNKSTIWQRSQIRVCRLARRLLSLLVLDAGSGRVIFSGATCKINPGTQVWQILLVLLKRFTVRPENLIIDMLIKWKWQILLQYYVVYTVHLSILIFKQDRG